MSSSAIRPPGQYLAHWHRCLEWLACQPGMAQIPLQEFDTPAQLNTAHTKARAMKQSILRFPQWPYNIRVMVQRGELHFERRGLQLWALRRPRPTPVREILARAQASS